MCDPWQYEPLCDVEREVFSDPEFIKLVNEIIDSCADEVKKERERIS